MLKLDLMNALYQRHGDLTRRQVTAVVDDVIDIISGELAAGNAVNLFGFGKFRVTARKGRVCYNPRVGKRSVVPDYRCVKFKAGRKLRRRVREAKL